MVGCAAPSWCDVWWCACGVQAMCAPKMRAVYLEAREKLFVEGSAPDGMFFLVTGSIIFSRGGNALCSYRAGSYFGELSLMCFKERMFSAEAAQPTELYMLNAESIPDMLNSFPSVRLTLRDVARRRLEGFRQLCPDIPVARFFEHIVPGDLDTPADDDTTVQGFPGSARDVDPTANPFMSDLERKLVPGKQCVGWQASWFKSSCDLVCSCACLCCWLYVCVRVRLCTLGCFVQVCDDCTLPAVQVEQWRDQVERRHYGTPIQP